MKKIKVTVIAVLLFTLFSCDTSGLLGNDDANNDGNGSGDYSFIDQDLQGEHTDEFWELVSGVAEEDYFDNTQYSIELYNIEPRDGYSSTEPFAYSGELYNSLMFSIPKELGLYELLLDYNNTDDNFTVTFFNSDTYMNTIAAQGAVEILSIDNTEMTITGRMDVWFGDKSEFHVNGNFTVPFI